MENILLETNTQLGHIAEDVEASQDKISKVGITSRYRIFPGGGGRIFLAPPRFPSEKTLRGAEIKLGLAVDFVTIGKF